MKKGKIFRHLALLFALCLLLTACAAKEEEEEVAVNRRKKPAVSEESVEATAGSVEEEIPASEPEEAESIEEQEPEEEPKEPEEPELDELPWEWNVSRRVKRPAVDTELSAADVEGVLHPTVKSVRRYYYNEDRSMILAKAKWDEIALEPEEAKEYPKLAEVLKEHSESVKEDNTQEMELGLEDAEIFANKIGYYDEAVFQDSNSIHIERSDAKVFSFSEDNSLYTGGAHGMYGYGCYNYDVETGQLLAIEDFLTDRELLADALYETLISEYGEDAFFAPDNMRDQILQEIEEGTLNLVLTNRGLRAYFNPYEIAPYAAGVFTVNLYPEYYPDLIKQEYAGVSRDWIMELPLYESIGVDVNYDGVPEEIGFWNILDEDYQADVRYYVYADRAYAAVDVWTGWDSRAYLVKNGSKYYVYLIHSSENDMQRLHVVGFDADGKPELMSEEYWGLNLSAALKDWDYDDEDNPLSEYFQTKFVLTDPKNMMLESWTDLFSTKNGVRRYHADKSGIPTVNEGWETYRFYCGFYEFEVLKEVTGRLLDDDGNEMEDYLLPIGEIVTYIGTDNLTYGEVRTSEGRTIRIYMDEPQEGQDYSYTIEGTPVMEVFDGTIFAG